MSIGFLLSCSIIASFFLEYFVYSGGIFLFCFVVFVGGVLCLFYLYDTCLWFCLFWACESLEVSLAGRVMFSFCVGLRCVECRSGTIYLSASLGWVAGLYGFSFSWVLLRWVRYDLNSGGVVVRFFLCRLQFAVCSVGRWLFVVGLPFPYNNFFSYFGIICRSRIL